MKPLIIYHGNCANGYTAAWIAHHAFGGEAELYPGVYQQDPPDVAARTVFFLDFSYKRPVMDELALKAASITVIDHHKSAIDDLAGFERWDNVELVMDIKHSGAMLTWKFFRPEEEPPVLVQYVEDRDLWKFERAGSKEVSLTIFSFDYTIENWDRLSTMTVDRLIAEGGSIMRKHDKDVRELVKKMKRRATIGGYDVPIANLPYTMASDAGHLMAGGEPFAACYYDWEDGREFSLRSHENGIDVSEIAKQYGGGGHKHAAGFHIARGTIAVGLEV